MDGPEGDGGGAAVFLKTIEVPDDTQDIIHPLTA